MLVLTGLPEVRRWWEYSERTGLPGSVPVADLGWETELTTHLALWTLAEELSKIAKEIQIAVVVLA